MSIHFRATRAVSGVVAAITIATWIAENAAQAQSFPIRQVSIVVPSAPGGGMDVTSRIAAAKLSEQLGKPFIIENKPGRVAAPSTVAAASPDGYTLLAAPSASMAAAVALFKSLPYDPQKDFVPVALVTRLSFVLVSNPDAPFKNLKELIAYLKAHPNSLSYGSSGTGSISHLAMEKLKSMAGVDMTHVPYRGTVPSVTDVMSGHVALAFADPGAVTEFVASGKLRALGISTAETSPALLNVPPISEAGIPGYELSSWVMMVAPAKTPSDVVDKLNASFRMVFAQADVKQKIAALGFTPVETPAPAALRELLTRQIALETKIVRDIGLAGSE